MRIPSLIILLSCRTPDEDIKNNPVDTGFIELTDLDGDGYMSDEDCDDNDAQVNPSSDELCDGYDNNCNGEIDEGVLETFYIDNDDDGFGSEEDAVEACEAPEGYTPNGNDCDDMEASAYPSAPEQCDEIDNDCDGNVDEDLQTEWWLDEDGDGFGTADYFAEGCLAEEGFAANPDDCDDSNVDVNPDVEETCDEIDNNCDGGIDEDLTITAYLDADGDGYGDDTFFVEVCELGPGYVLVGGDCDDIDSYAYPGFNELCDDIDNNCDGQVDEGVGSTGTPWYWDGDGDGFGDTNQMIMGCNPDPGYVPLDGDCDDFDSNNFPGNIEQCDGQDNNCDTLVDDDDTLVIGQLTWYQDSDADGMGSTLSMQACFQPSGYVAGTGDCNDANNVIYDGAPEICDTLDNDCDGFVDDADADIIGQQTWYQDSDADGNGSNVSQISCFQPTGYVPTTGDCNDANTAIYDGAPELCDTLDNDCNGLTDDADAGVIGQVTYYTDGDLDGYGDAAQSTTVCFQPAGTVTNAGDCDDTDATISPVGTEVCDGQDNDCDGLFDDDDGSVVGQGTWYLDSDGDGFGGGLATVSCVQPSQNMIQLNGDCDDTSAAINPNAQEVCDGLDNDCDSTIDDADSSVDTSTMTTWYTDADGDGFGTTTTQQSCTVPSTGTLNTGDCDDGNSSVYPDAPEDWDCIDTNCDGFDYPVGDGRDGAYSLSSSGTFGTASTYITSSMSAGQTQIAVANGGIFTAGDYVMFWDAYGSNAGQWSIEYVEGVSGNSLNLANGVNTNGTSGTTWAVRLPQYTDVNISGTLNAPAFGGSSSPLGGMIAFLANGTVSISGSVSASGNGYRGGARTYSQTQTGHRGESYNGSYNRSTSANYSGGGGGHSPSLTHASGGGGGHAGNGGSGTAVGGWGNTAGAAGGSVGNSALSNLYYGGAGGSGSLDSDAGGGSYGGAGGNGGGLVLFSSMSLSGGGAITSNGSNGENGYYSNGSASPGGGGGGAGGSIYIVTNSNGSSISLQAIGGNGGIGSEAGGSQTRTGSGASGRIRYDLSGSSLSSTPSAYSTCP